MQPFPEWEWRDGKYRNQNLNVSSSSTAKTDNTYPALTPPGARRGPDSVYMLLRARGAVAMHLAVEQRAISTCGCALR